MPDSGAPTILVVDDQPTILRTLTRFLALKGYTVETAETSADVIPALESRKIDAVVLDLRMPGQSGLDLLMTMRADDRWRDLPAVLLTGAILTADEQATLARLKAFVFFKPKSYEQLASYLSRVTRAPSNR